MDDNTLWQSRVGNTCWGHWFEVTENRIRAYRHIRGKLPGDVKPMKTTAPPKPQTMECPECEGEGGFRRWSYCESGYRFMRDWWETCETCGGEGHVCIR